MNPFETEKVRRAVSDETELRDAAFIGLEDEIAGVRVKPLTLGHYLRLTLAGNPFVAAKPAKASDAAIYLYVTSEARESQKAFAKRIGGHDLVKVFDDIARHLTAAFFDAPPTTGAGGYIPSYYSVAASLVDLFGREYGWPIETTMRAPLATLFQLMRTIQRRTNPDIPLFNPLSDRALTEAAQAA